MTAVTSMVDPELISAAPEQAGYLPAGEIIVSMREEPFRVQLAEVLAPATGERGVVSAALIISDGGNLVSQGAQTDIGLNTFLSLRDYSMLMKRSYELFQTQFGWKYFGSVAR